MRREGVPQHLDDIGTRTDGVVDDPLRQLKRQIEQREKQQRHGQQNKLIAAGMLPDKAHQRPFDARPFPLKSALVETVYPPASMCWSQIR